MTPTTHPLFWRDSALPFVELRQVLDGRDVSYAPHSHEEWSIGAILEGKSEFVCADRLHAVERGILVMMTPNVVHACNPSQDSPWAYYMMHLDKNWLALLLNESGVRSELVWQDCSLDTIQCTRFYQDFVFLCDSLMSVELSSLEKIDRLKRYFIGLFEYVDSVGQGEGEGTNGSRADEPKQKESKTLLPANNLYQVAHYLNEYSREDTSIDHIGAEFGFSTGYLVRAFKRHFNITPHAYRLNRRIQLGQQALKEGQTIADVAQTIGFSDQAHFQRVFKQRVAATPDQYRRVNTSNK